MPSMSKFVRLRSTLVAVGAVVLAITLASCGGESSNETVADVGAESGEHNGASDEHEGEESGDGGGEESGTQYGLTDTYDETRAGVRLVLAYDATANAFVGTARNVSYSTASRVRVEVHLSNGIELGPTTPTDLSRGQVIDVVLPATEASFETWSAHPEVGGAPSSDDEYDDSEDGY